MSKKEIENDVVENDIIELIDDDGNKVNFECLLTFDHKDCFYAALLPVEKVEGIEEGEVLLMRIDDDDETEITSLSPLETEEEMDEVWETFIKLYEDGEDDCDCEDCDCDDCDCDDCDCESEDHECGEEGCNCGCKHE